jgi:nucleoside-diphosphate-sugar epimerase
MSKAVLIFGATGKQGGAVLNHLIRRNADFKILAVTRNAKSASAQKLLQKSQNVKLVEGNAMNPRLIFESARETSGLPIWGVFSVQVDLTLSFRDAC